MTAHRSESEVRAELTSILSYQAAPTSNTRNKPLEDYVNTQVDLPNATTYATSISLSRNVGVRFSQSDRARRAHILVAVLPEDIEPQEFEAIVQSAQRYIEKERAGCECVLIQPFEQSIKIPAAIFPASRPEPLVSAFLFSETKMVQIKSDHGSGESAVSFIVAENDHPVRQGQYPYATLRRDQWDDYGWQSLFHLTLHLSESAVHSIGPVKVLRRGQPSGPTEMPESPFQSLPPDYYSLGQSYSYYERIANLPGGIHSSILGSLRDIVKDPRPIGEISSEPAYSRSLLRTGAAVRALADSPEIFKSAPPTPTDDGLGFTFSTSVGGNNFSVDFSFNDNQHLPSRVNAIIGFNGSGKTQLLANLALVATGDLEQRDERLAHGKILESSKIRFSAVIAVSYSAFDTFEMPNEAWRSDHQRDNNDSGDIFGYSYIGLRKSAKEDLLRSNKLKSINEIEEEFYSALAEASTAQRRHAFRRAMRKLLTDPSFGRTGLDSLLDPGPENPWRETFLSLSTGHKIVLNTIAQLVAKCAPKALVLIDEPESHLHPSLLSAFIHATGEVLRCFDSYAIVTTHSPVVLQEIPKRYVQIISRFGSLTRIDSPTTETFGENIGTLTREAFDLDNTQSDYHAVLRRLSDSMTIDEIEKLFDGELSGNARAYLLALRRSNRQGIK